jgi:hypothetical protein
VAEGGGGGASGCAGCVMWWWCRRCPDIRVWELSVWGGGVRL